MQDDVWMAQALLLAEASAGLASPNPQVGCVLVREGMLIAEGSHRYEQRDHAEIAALRQAASNGLSVEGATAYVTLEPCSHHGRTGPCVDALIAARVARVVVGTVDPNPRVSGQGIARLRVAGVAVTVGVCEEQARRLVESFSRFIRYGRPFVTLKAALSVDGKLAPPAAQRLTKQPFWLTGEAARAEVQRMRHAADAVLTGIGTVLADDPFLSDRTGLPRRRPLLRVVLDTLLRLPVGANLVLGAEKGDVLVLCGDAASPARRKTLEELGVIVAGIRVEDGQLSLPAVLTALAEREIVGLLLECGSHLNGAFLAQNLVDRVALFYAETELGDQAVPFAQGAASPFLLEQKLSRVNRTSFGQDAFVTGYLRDPWADVV